MEIVLIPLFCLLVALVLFFLWYRAMESKDLNKEFGMIDNALVETIIDMHHEGKTRVAISTEEEDIEYNVTVTHIPDGHIGARLIQLQEEGAGFITYLVFISPKGNKVNVDELKNKELFLDKSRWL